MEFTLIFINSSTSEELMKHSSFMKYLLEMTMSGMPSLNTSVGLVFAFANPSAQKFVFTFVEKHSAYT